MKSNEENREDERVVVALFLQEKEDDDDHYDRTAQRLASENPALLRKMIGQLPSRQLRAAIFGFGTRGDNLGREIALSYLEHADPLIAAEAIDALRRTDPAAWPRVSGFLAHASPFVRGAALRFARAALGNEAVPVLAAALDDSDPIVRQNALDELDGIATPSLSGKIAMYLGDADEGVRQAAESLLESLR